MFFTNLSQLKLFGLLNSESVLGNQLALLFKPSMQGDDVRRGFINELHARFGYRMRKFEIESATRDVFDDFGLPNFAHLEIFFDNLYDINFFNITLKKGTEEEFSTIAKDFNPLIIIAYKMATIYKNNNSCIRTIEHIIDNITPLGIANNCNKEYAENHIHLGGANDPSASLIIIANMQSHKLLSKKLNIRPNSYPNSKYTIEQLVSIYKTLFNYINNMNFNSCESITPAMLDPLKYYLEGNFPTHYPKSRWLDNKLLQTSIFPHKFSQLAFKYYQNKEYHKSFFAYILWLFNVYHESKTVEEKRIVAIIILTVGILRSDMVMANLTGLENFIDFYDSKIRKIANKQNETHLFETGTTHIEFKAFEKKINNDQLEQYYTDFSKAISKQIIKKNYPPEYKFLLEKGIIPYENEKYGFQYCYHIIKKGDKRIKKGANLKKARHNENRIEIFSQLRKIRNYLHSSRTVKSLWDIYYSKLDGDGKFESEKYSDILKNSLIDLRKIFRTIDAAGNEIIMPPEVYAPYVRFFRKQISITDAQTNFNKMKKITFAFHAGEDFSHIATGMRRVDETINFLDYTENDRIGHALAIGIDPHDWALKGDIAMKKGDRLDDLVWLWNMAIELHSPLTDYLLKKARSLGIEIYGNKWDIYYAYEAYELRRYCPIYSFKKNTISYKELTFEDKKVSNEAKELFYNYHFCCDVYRKTEDIMVLKKEVNNNTEERIAKDELDFLHQVQEKQIKTYAERGVSIEANLSSNIYIANISDIDRHPVLRWSPIGDVPKIKVSVNTDDPCIFPTTLQNEFKMFKNKLLKSGKYNAQEIESWIERLRESGLEIFKQNHI